MIPSRYNVWGNEEGNPGDDHKHSGGKVAGDDVVRHLQDNHVVNHLHDNQATFNVRKHWQTLLDLPGLRIASLAYLNPSDKKKLSSFVKLKL